MFMHFHAYILSSFYILIYIFLLVLFFFFLSLSLSLALVCTIAPKRKSTHPRTLSILGHLLLLLLTLHLLIYGSVMMKPKRTSRRTFVDEAFIRNAMSFCQTFPTLTYPLSFIVGVGSHFVTSQSLIPL